jgi:predicted N-acetyltransferase YhbS
MEIEIRAARTEDIEGISALIGERIGDEDAEEAEIVLRDPDFDRQRWFVAADGDEVLSTAAIFPGQLRFGGVTMLAGAIEFVATSERAEGQGLVRRLLDEIHRTASSRGEMLQWIVGITYFYRRFGYEYAIPVDGMHLFAADTAPPRPEGWSVRAAEHGEIETIARSQESFARVADVSITATKWVWDMYRRSPNYEVVVAEGPREQAFGRIYAWDEDRYLTDIVAQSVAGAAALISAAADDGQWDVSVLSRPGARRYLEELAPWTPSHDAYYLRVADPVALLEAIRPELTRRLEGQSEPDPAEDALISLYGSSIRFAYARRRVGPIRREGAVPGPISEGGSGVAPDQIVSLILGPLGAAGLAELHPDVNLGEQADLMEALFPPQTCDVHSWVVP